VGGYWMIQVKSREEAVEWAKRAPMLDGDMIEVRQVQELELKLLGRPQWLPDDDTLDDFDFEPGQMVLHPRFGLSVVVAWMTDRPMGRWGRHCFLLAQRGMRVVSEIDHRCETYHGEPTPSLMRYAGQFFRRWDAASGLFADPIGGDF